MSELITYAQDLGPEESDAPLPEEVDALFEVYDANAHSLLRDIANVAVTGAVQVEEVQTAHDPDGAPSDAYELTTAPLVTVDTVPVIVRQPQSQPSATRVNIAQ